ncbi:MAG: hypothetical protein GDA46_01655 [Bdellovibrionales bacterium]|nr:hypothetical protein [Bdellovibrionales bacterium]
MIKLLTTALSALTIIGCSSYTVKVNVAGVTINGQKVEEGACVRYDDSLFGLLGDFPLTITLKEESKDYEANDYEVTSEEVKVVDTACEVEEKNMENETSPEEEEKKTEIETESNEENTSQENSESESATKE